MRFLFACPSGREAAHRQSTPRRSAGTGSRARTCGLYLIRVLLFQLSYTGILPAYGAGDRFGRCVPSDTSALHAGGRTRTVLQIPRGAGIARQPRHFACLLFFQAALWKRPPAHFPHPLPAQKQAKHGSTKCIFIYNTKLYKAKIYIYLSFL